MNQPLSPLDPLLLTIVLATLAIGLPVLIVLSVRFLWDRKLNLGRSKELEKLIWQLHRIASALEHQMNLSFPAVQPGTEEPRDLAYLQQIAAKPAAVSPSAAISNATGASPALHQPAAQAPVIRPPVVPQPVLPEAQAAAQQPSAPVAAAEEPALPALERRDPNAEVPRAGVNSMFGL
jgi:hypothetical protein